MAGRERGAIRLTSAPTPTPGRARSAEGIARFAPANLRAALWALRALAAARRALPERGIDSGGSIPDPPPRLPDGAARGVRAALNRRRASCLERALVLQAWYRAHDEPRDVVIGVKDPGEQFGAHAWLAGEEGHEEAGFTELIRRPA